MMKSALFWGIFMGIMLYYIGSFLMGYVLAVVIPDFYFELFKGHVSLALAIIHLLSQLIAFIIPAILIGLILARVINHFWLTSVSSCYFMYIVLMIYHIDLSVTFSYLSLSLDVFSQLMVAVALFVTVKKSFHNKAKRLANNHH